MAGRLSKFFLTYKVDHVNSQNRMPQTGCRLVAAILMERFSWNYAPLLQAEVLINVDLI